jgi:hypothetical protein
MYIIYKCSSVDSLKSKSFLVENNQRIKLRNRTEPASLSCMGKQAHGNWLASQNSQGLWPVFFHGLNSEGVSHKLSSPSPVD